MYFLSSFLIKKCVLEPLTGIFVCFVLLHSTSDGPILTETIKTSVKGGR